MWSHMGIFVSIQLSGPGKLHWFLRYLLTKGLSSQGYGFSSSHVWMSELDYKESWAPKNWCFWTVVLEKTLESPLDCKEIQPVYPKGNQSLNIYWKDWCWSWNSNTLATWCEELTHLKRPRCWERLRIGGKGDNRGWDGWMVSPTHWTWVWVDSGSLWWTGRPGMLQFIGLQKVGQDWATEVNWTEHQNAYAWLHSSLILDNGLLQSSLHTTGEWSQILIKNALLGNSPVVQWLGLHSSTGGSMGLIFGISGN